MEPDVYFRKGDIKGLLLLLDANESLRGKVVTAARRVWLRFRLGLPCWIRPSVLGGRLYMIMPGVIISYDYKQLMSRTNSRRNGD